VGQLSESTIRLQAGEYERLTKALESLEPLQDGFDKRRTIGVEMRAPVFEDSPVSHSTALKAACQRARAQAEELAAKMGCRLGTVLIVREGPLGRRGAGFGSDYDWGDYDRIYNSEISLLCAASPVEESAPPAALQRPKQTVFVRVAVRFALIS
jgi:hypothetical protein